MSAHTSAASRPTSRYDSLGGPGWDAVVARLLRPRQDTIPSLSTELITGQSPHAAGGAAGARPSNDARAG